MQKRVEPACLARSAACALYVGLIDDCQSRRANARLPYATSWLLMCPGGPRAEYNQTPPTQLCPVLMPLTAHLVYLVKVRELRRLQACPILVLGALGAVAAILGAATGLDGHQRALLNLRTETGGRSVQFRGCTRLCARPTRHPRIMVHPVDRCRLVDELHEGRVKHLLHLFPTEKPSQAVRQQGKAAVQTSQLRLQQMSVNTEPHRAAGADCMRASSQYARPRIP